MILSTDADFTKRGWVTRVYEQHPDIPLKRSDISSWVCTYMPSFCKKCYIYKRDRHHLYDNYRYQKCMVCGGHIATHSFSRTGLCLDCYKKDRKLKIKPL